MTKRKNKNLAAISQTILHRCLHEDWRPTTAEMQLEYGLNDPQMHKVKVGAKKLASWELGLLWGYHDVINAYRVCPQRDSVVAEQMIQYHVRHWGDAGRSMFDMIHGAREMGLVTEESANAAKTQTLDATAEIGRIFSKLVFEHNSPAIPAPRTSSESVRMQTSTEEL